MTKRYKNKFDRAMNDANWEGDDDGYAYSAPRKIFRRNKIDGVMGGVCAGIGDYLNVDPIVVRILTVISFFMTGVTFFIYIGFWIFTPSDNRAPYRREHRQARKARRKHQDDPSEPLTRPAASYRTVRGKFSSLEGRLQDLEKSITSSEWQLRRDFRDLES